MSKTTDTANQPPQDNEQDATKPEQPQVQDRMQRSPGGPGSRTVRESVITRTGAAYSVGQKVSDEQAKKDKLEEKYLR